MAATNSNTTKIVEKTENSPESIITKDVKAQKNQDDVTYINLRSTNEMAAECQSIIKTIKTNQPENDVMKDVVNADIVGIKELPDNIASRFINLSLYRNVWSEVKTYYVGINYSVKNESRWFYNGVNYRLYVLALENNQWVIVESAMAPSDLIVNTGYGFSTQDEKTAIDILKYREKTGKFINKKHEVIEDIAATSDQLKKEKGTTTTQIIPDATDVAAATTGTHTCPSSIRVYRTASGTVDVINFYSYLKGVLPCEWIPSWNMKLLESGALACKMYGWYYVYYPHSSSYDVKDSTVDQVYNPSKENTNTTQAINNVGGIGIDAANGSLFICHYWAGSNGPGRIGPSSCPTDGWMWQNGTNYWWNNGQHGYTYCGHYYYDNSDSTNNQLAHFFYY